MDAIRAAKGVSIGHFSSPPFKPRRFQAVLATGPARLKEVLRTLARMCFRIKTAEKRTTGRNNSGLNRQYPQKGNIYSPCNYSSRIVSVYESCYRNELSAS